MRDINKIILHCSASRCDKDFDVNDSMRKDEMIGKYDTDFMPSEEFSMTDSFPITTNTISNNTNNNSNDKKLFEQTIIDRLKPLNIPIILGFPCGHNYPNLTIPIGCNILFDSISKNIIFLDSFLNNKKASE